MREKLALVVCFILIGLFPITGRAGPVNPDASQQAEELIKLSETQNLTSHSLAVETAQAALALFQSAGNSVGIATAYRQIGRYFYAQNSLIEATQYYNLALQMWRQQNNVQEEADALIMLSYIEGRKGEWLKGVDFLGQARNLTNAASEPDRMGRIASGMAYLFNESGLPESGLAKYQEAMEYFGQAQNARYYNRMILQIGYTYFLRENYSAALSNLQHALGSFEPSSLDAAECHEYMGRVYIATGQHEVALQHLLPILPIYDDAGNPREAAQVRAMIGQIYEQQGLISRARTSYLEVSETFRRVSDRVNDAAVRFALGRLEMKSGNYEAAEKYLKESIDNTENIRRDLTSRVFAAAFSASVHDRYEAYIECLMRKGKSQPSQNLEVLAFEASELARARSLAELLRDTQTNLLAGTDARLSEQEKALRQSIRAKVDYKIALLAGTYSKSELDETGASLASLREEHNRITEKLRKLNPHYGQLNEPTVYSLQQVQEQVIEDDQTMLLEYLLGENASYVWVITRNDMKVFELPKAGVIEEAVGNVYKVLSIEPNGDTESRLNKATAELGRIVLGPLADRLKTPRIIVVADGALNYIPFQLLPAPSGGQPLVANYEVINAPSASVLGQLRQEKQQRLPRAKTLAAFGDPVFVSNYTQFKDSNAGEQVASPRAEGTERSASRDIEVNADILDPSDIQSLLFSKIELNNLREIAGSASFVARGFEASREMLVSTDLSKFAILHFATHGRLNPKNPEQSGFFLSMVDAAGRPQDGFIKMSDVYRLQAPVDLVVLSACRTGLGKDVRGEGLIGLTRGFMYAGASSVVASLWRVDDEATAELMKHFYTNMLQKGMRPAEALRAAQNTLRQNPVWQSPHFWAGFTLQGEFKQPIRLPITKNASPVVQNAVGGGLLLTLLVGIAWGYLRRRPIRPTKPGYSTLNK